MFTRWIELVVNCAVDAAPLLSLAAVLISLFTLREMQLQRQKTYEPQLFLSDLSVWMQKNQNGVPCILKLDWKSKRSDMSLPFFDLDMHNIGLGAANTITIIWRYDQNALIDKFKELGSQTKMLRSNREGHFEYLFFAESDTGYGFSIESLEESKVQLSFLMANASTRVRMPQAIYNYLTFMPFLELLRQDMPRRIDINEELCAIEFIYYDIGGKKHNQKIKMCAELYAYSKEFSENNYALASIFFRKH